MREYYSLTNEADQKLRQTGKKNNIISFNGQGRSGKTTQAKQLVEAKSNSYPDKYRYMLCHNLRDKFKNKFYDQSILILIMIPIKKEDTVG